MSNITGIRADLAQSDDDAGKMEKASAFLQREALTPKDETTTLCANQSLHFAYDMSQGVLEQLGGAVDKEASNIRSTGVTFEQYDKMLAELGGGVSE